MTIDVGDEISRTILAIVVANNQGDIALIDDLILEAIEEWGAFNLATGMLGFFSPFIETFALAMGKPLDVLLQELGTKLATDD